VDYTFKIDSIAPKTHMIPNMFAGHAHNHIGDRWHSMNWQQEGCHLKCNK